MKNSKKKAFQPFVVALIPAREGSKSIKNKNIRFVAGKPLLAHSIEHGLNSKLVDRVIVSTDSAKYAQIAKKYGAEVPFLRPCEFAQDNSTDLQVFKHYLNWLKKNEMRLPDICVHLRPTHPIRQVNDIDNMINILIENPQIDSVRSIVTSKEIPYKMWLREENGLIKPLLKLEVKDSFNLPRQNLPTTYYQNASVDVVRTGCILNMNSMNGKTIYGYLMDEFYDIDNFTELRNVRRVLRK